MKILGLFHLGTHYIIFDSIVNSTALHRDLGNKLFFRALPTFSTPNQLWKTKSEQVINDISKSKQLGYKQSVFVVNYFCLTFYYKTETLPSFREFLRSIAKNFILVEWPH